MAYAAIPPEVDLGPVLEETLKREKTFCCPQCNPDGTMTARNIRALSELCPGPLQHTGACSRYDHGSGRRN